MHDDEPRLIRWGNRPTWQIYWRRSRTSTGARIDAGRQGRIEAEAALARFKAELARPAPGERVTTGLILAQYLAQLRTSGKPGAERAAWSIKRLSEHLDTLAPEDVDVQEYVDARLDDGVGLRTTRTELESLRAAFNWAASLKQPLLATAPKIVLPAKGEGRVRWLSPDEATALLDACNARHLHTFVMIALNTASRLTAILQLQWQRVDLDNRLIDFRMPGITHVKKRRVPVPINDQLHAELVAARDRAETEWVIEWANGPVHSIRHGFDEARQRAGLSDDVTPHVLCHTAITWMLQRSISIWDAAGLSGRTPDTIQRVYAHHHPEYLRSAAAALGSASARSALVVK